MLEEQVSGTVTVRNVYSPGYVDDLVLRDRDSDSNGSLDERLYVLSDANHNVVALVNTSGTVVERYVYDPYGAVTVKDGSYGSRGSSSYAWVNLHQGLRLDSVAGLYENRARFYSPTLGRFVSNDPMLYQAGDNNLYRYVGNSPTGWVDPSGLWGLGDLIRGVARIPGKLGAAMGPTLLRKDMPIASWLLNEAHNAKVQPLDIAEKEAYLGEPSPEVTTSWTGRPAAVGRITVDTIRKSTEYKALLKTICENANKDGEASSKADPTELKFESNIDLFAAFHKTKATWAVKKVTTYWPEKKTMQKYRVEITIKDDFNFEFKNDFYGSTYNKMFFGTVNNLAAIEQGLGVLNEFPVTIKMVEYCSCSN